MELRFCFSQSQNGVLSTSVVYTDTLPITPSTPVSDTTHALASDELAAPSLSTHITDSFSTTHETLPTTAVSMKTAVTTAGLTTTVSTTVVPTMTVSVPGPSPSVVPSTSVS